MIVESTAELAETKWIRNLTSMLAGCWEIDWEERRVRVKEEDTETESRGEKRSQSDLLHLHRPKSDVNTAPQGDTPRECE